MRPHLGAGVPHHVDHLAHRAVAAVLAAGGDVLVDVLDGAGGRSRGRGRAARRSRSPWSLAQPESAPSSFAASSPTLPGRPRVRPLGAARAVGLVSAMRPSCSNRNRTCSSPVLHPGAGHPCRASPAGRVSSRRYDPTVTTSSSPLPGQVDVRRGRRTAGASRSTAPVPVRVIRNGPSPSGTASGSSPSYSRRGEAGAARRRRPARRAGTPSATPAARRTTRRPRPAPRPAPRTQPARQSSAPSAGNTRLATTPSTR